MRGLDLFYGNHWDMAWLYDWPDHPFVAEPSDEFSCVHCCEPPEDHINWPEVLSGMAERIRIMDIDYED